MEYGGGQQQERVVFQDEEGRKVGVIVGRVCGIGVRRMPQVCEGQGDMERTGHIKPSVESQ